MPAEALPQPPAAAEPTAVDAGAPEDPGALTRALETSQEAVPAAPVRPSARALLSEVTVTPVATVDDLIVYGQLGELDDTVRAGLEMHLGGLIASLERQLHRPIEVREFIEDVVITTEGRLWLTQTPVQAITRVVVDGTDVSALTDPRGYLWRPGATVRVTYTAGMADERSRYALRLTLLAKALPWARSLLTRLAVPDPAPSAGAGAPLPAPVPGVTAFAVEGLSVTYASDADLAAAVTAAAVADAALAQWTPQELAGVGWARRPVVA